MKRYVQPTTARLPSTLWQESIPRRNFIGAKTTRRNREGAAEVVEATAEGD